MQARRGRPSPHCRRPSNWCRWGTLSASTAYGYLAALYTNQGDIAQAIVVGQKGVQLNPQDDIALSALAFAFIATGQQSQAIPLLLKAVAINPRESSYWQFLAQAYRLSDQQAKAMTAAQRAVALARTMKGHGMNWGKNGKGQAIQQAPSGHSSRV